MENVLLHFEKLRPKQSLPSCCHFPFTLRSARCKKATEFRVLHITNGTIFLHCKIIRVVVEGVVIVFGELIVSLVPQCWRAFSFFYLWKFRFYSLTGANSLASAKDCTSQNLTLFFFFFFKFEISMGCGRKRKTGFCLVNQYFLLPSVKKTYLHILSQVILDIVLMSK